MRLIDADALYDAFERTPWMDNADRDIAEEVAENAPTVAEDNNVPVKQPDPITGLVPCGCGGKASEYFVEHPYVDKGSYVECRWCRINVVGVNKQDAHERWNTAMGWRADE